MTCEHYYLECVGNQFGLGARVRISEFDLICMKYWGPAERISDGVKGWFSNGSFEAHTMAVFTHLSYKRAHSALVVTVKGEPSPQAMEQIRSAFQAPNQHQWIYSDPEVEIRPLYSAG